MAIKHDLINYLLGSTGVSALVGTRIRPNKLDEADYTSPSIVIGNLGGETQDHMSGTDGLTRGRLEIRSYGATDLAASNVDLACYRVLHTLADSIGASSATVVTDLIASEPFSGFEYREDGSQAGAHRYTRDLEIWYFQTAPAV